MMPPSFRVQRRLTSRNRIDIRGEGEPVTGFPQASLSSVENAGEAGGFANDLAATADLSE
jgi:hypothetical protein